MELETMFISDELNCPPNGVPPTIQEFNLGLGDYAIALYVLCGTVIVILALLYGLLVGHILHAVPKRRQVATLWVTSVYLVVAVLTTFGVVLPKCANFIWLFYKVYVGMAMGRFVELTMAWYGGETEMLLSIGEENKVSFRVRPCCCCLCLPQSTSLTKTKIRVMKACVFQMPYTQGCTLFLMAVLELGGYLEYGNMSPMKPYLYLSGSLLVSFFAGIWGLFVFMDITKRFSQLSEYEYRKKSVLLKLMVVFVNVQGIIVDILANYGAFACIPPFISASTVGDIIKSLLCITESLVLGCFCYKLYIDDNSGG